MMTVLILGLVIFLGTHSIRLCSPEWRSAQVARLGDGRWKLFYTIASVLGFVLLVWGFGLARRDTILLWAPPVWTHHVAALLVLIAFILLAAAYVPGTRIKALVGHPMVAGTKTWALGHLAANGSLADVVLFGSFLVWAVAYFAIARRRDRAAGTRYPAVGIQRDVLAVVIGALVWFLFARFAHLWLFGVSPMG